MMTYLTIVFLSAFYGIWPPLQDKPMDGDGLVWSDEFNHDGIPDTTFWSYAMGDGCPSLCGWGNNEVQKYTNSPENVRIKDGVLIIEATKNNGQWTSGRIHTKSKMEFTYGRIEFRAKLPAGVGSWPALWMLGANIDEAGWPACGEIDVVEHVGKNQGVILSALHTNASHGNTIHKSTFELPTCADRFHVYAVDWSEGKIQFSIDGVPYYTYAPKDKTINNWPYDEPFFILLNIAMGGNLGGPIIDQSLAQLRMEVDYVRVYRNNI